MKEKHDVILIGAGPTGIFTALELIENCPGLDILILDKGEDIDDRVCPMKERPGSGSGCYSCSSCAIVSGWGGAGAFSDGKLALSANVGGNLEEYIGREELEALIDYADNWYLEFGAPERIFGADEKKMEEFRDRAVRAGLKFIPARLRHLGTGHTREVLRNMRDYLLEKGVEIQVKSKVEGILLAEEKRKIAGVKLENGKELRANYVSVAPGRENSRWLKEQVRDMGLETSLNPVDIGVRVETPAAIARPLTENLYESKLIYQSPTFDDRVRTFCTCPHGEVVSENNQGLITVNGHSHADIKTENTNFALLVSKTFTEPFREPITYGRYIAHLANLLGGGVLVQRLGDLLEGQRSTLSRMKRGIVEPTLKEATPGDLSLVLPYRHLISITEMIKALDKITPGVYSRHTLLYGVEVKFYSSRIEVDQGLKTEINNFYVGGDGAGITRGLVQASVSGMVIAESILKNHS